MTQTELAKALAITQSNVSSIERGARGITVHQVVKLAEALHATTDEILRPKKKSDTSQDGLLGDRRFLRRLQKLEQIPPRDQQALLRTIDNFLKASIRP